MQASNRGATKTLAEHAYTTANLFKMVLLLCTSPSYMYWLLMGTLVFLLMANGYTISVVDVRVFYLLGCSDLKLDSLIDLPHLFKALDG